MPFYLSIYCMQYYQFIHLKGRGSMQFVFKCTHFIFSNLSSLDPWLKYFQQLTKNLKVIIQGRHETQNSLLCKHALFCVLLNGSWIEERKCLKLEFKKNDRRQTLYSVYICFYKQHANEKKKINNGFFTIYKQQRKTWQPSLS